MTGSGRSQDIEGTGQLVSGVRNVEAAPDHISGHATLLRAADTGASEASRLQDALETVLTVLAQSEAEVRERIHATTLNGHEQSSERKYAKGLRRKAKKLSRFSQSYKLRLASERDLQRIIHVEQERSRAAVERVVAYKIPTLTGSTSKVDQIDRDETCLGGKNLARTDAAAAAAAAGESQSLDVCVGDALLRSL